MILFSELATYHHNAPYHSQQCSAMFLLSGVLVPRGKEWRSSQSQSQVQTQPDTQDEDVNMDATQHETTQQYQSQAMSLEEDFEEEDSEEVDEIVILIVNEKDFEGSQHATLSNRIFTGLLFFRCQSKVSRDPLDICL